MHDCIIYYATLTFDAIEATTTYKTLLILYANIQIASTSKKEKKMREENSFSTEFHFPYTCHARCDKARKGKIFFFFFIKEFSSSSSFLCNGNFPHLTLFLSFLVMSLARDIGYISRKNKREKFALPCSFQ